MNRDTAGVPEPGHVQEMEAIRPDSTKIEVYLTWNNDRPAPLTVDELTKFAEAFNY
jgi:hypothetical protein